MTLPRRLTLWLLAALILSFLAATSFFSNAFAQQPSPTPGPDPTSVVIGVMDAPRPGLIMVVAFVLVAGWIAFWTIKNRIRRG